MGGEKAHSDKRHLVLIVDDEERNRKFLKVLCGNLGYETIEAANGEGAVAEVHNHAPDLVLMDVMMPGMDGLEATERLKGDKRTDDIPIIIVTALDSREDRLAGIAKGANDFLTKPVDAEELSLRVRNSLRIKEFSDFLKDHNVILEREVAKRTDELRTAFTRLDEAHETIKSAYIETIQRLTLASEYKDEETGAHIKRVSHYTKTISERLGLDSEFIEDIYYSSPMHDIGKVSIPDSILLKPGRLTPEEFEIMKTHTTVGGRILEGSSSPFLKMGVKVALCHHERWDGSGYPRGLKGEEIPLAARIMNIVDQYDALRSKRPYKPAFEHEKALAIITEGDDRTCPDHFDPAVLNAFKESSDTFKEIFESHQD
ncbi:MAG: HD domain-containing phosphohydrolase [Thermodesulfobacteriota bacterium]